MADSRGFIQDEFFRKNLKALCFILINRFCRKRFRE
jgi:hypothetical protein